MLTHKKTIAYTRNWIQTLWISAIMGVFFSIIIIFLEPFDTGIDVIPNLTLKLAGYGFCFMMTILVVHFIENYVYKKQRRRWFIVNEIIYLLITFLVVTSVSYLYHWYFISDKDTLYWSEWFGFVINYGTPFLPIIIPLWIFLRSKFGVIEITVNKVISEETITITGDNKAESLPLTTSSFVYAQSQQNYVTIYYKAEDNSLQQKMLRSTLSNLNKQLPNARQVHRSYLVNLDYLKAVEGNVRKRVMHLTIVKNPIPISQKYFTALQKHLSNSSQKVHE